MFTKEMLRLVELFVAKGVGIVAVLKIILHLMPSFLVLTLPIACLIASITAFNRLSFDKELVAMRGAGMSLLRISMPVWIFSFAILVLTLVMSQWGQPWTNISLKHLALRLIQDRLTVALDRGVFNEPAPNLLVYIPEPVDQQTDARGIFISDQRDRSKPMVIVANTFRLLQDPNRAQLGIRLFDGTIHQAPLDPREYHQVAFTTYDLKLDLSSSLEPVQERPAYDEIVDKLESSQWRDPDALRRMVEYYKDLAFPMASLFLGILGLPVGIVSKRSGRIGGFAIGVLIIIGYYLLNVVGEFLVTTLVLHPFAGAWLPNAVLILTTITLFYRSSRA